MENNTTSIFLRCPLTLAESLKDEAKVKGFRSVQEYILQIMREREELEVIERERSTNVGA